MRVREISAAPGKQSTWKSVKPFMAKAKSALGRSRSACSTAGWRATIGFGAGGANAGADHRGGWLGDSPTRQTATLPRAPVVAGRACAYRAPCRRALWQGVDVERGTVQVVHIASRSRSRWMGWVGYVRWRPAVEHWRQGLSALSPTSVWLATTSCNCVNRLARLLPRSPVRVLPTYSVCTENYPKSRINRLRRSLWLRSRGSTAPRAAPTPLVSGSTARQRQRPGQKGGSTAHCAVARSSTGRLIRSSQPTASIPERLIRPLQRPTHR